MNIAKLSKEMKEAIGRSGYLLEQETATILKKKGFYVVPNYAFRDIETDTSKEIDVWGMMAKLLDNREGFEGIFPVLLIEVKNIFPLVCFTQDEVTARYTMGDFQFSGLPKYVWVKSTEGEELLDFLKIEKFHHYYKTSRIASQFCVISENKRRRGNPNEPPFVASHRLSEDRNLYEEIALPLIKGIMAEKEKHEKEWEFDHKREPINLQFYYPIAVVNGLFECYVGRKTPVYKKVHQINFIRRYESKQISGEFRIDICDRLGFEQLVNVINTEVEKIAKKIRNHKKLLQKSALIDAKEKYREQKNIKNKKRK